MATKKRLINCDFLNDSGFMTNLTNKAKLLYFFFLTNCDDKGFVGNAPGIASSLDQCEETYDNTLFNYKYKDALEELVDKRLAIEFIDKVGNRVFLVRHWFFHNNSQKFLSTNYVSFLAQVYLENNKYYLKTHTKGLEEKTKKEKEIKGNKRKGNETIKDIEINNDKGIENDDWEQEWDKTIKELENMPKGDN